MAYINTENLFKCETCRRYRGGKCLAWCESYECYSPSLKKIPTADVVEVVRCKDCKNCIKVDDLDGGHWECIAHYDNHGRPYIPKLDGFCDCGEKALKEREKE